MLITDDRADEPRWSAIEDTASRSAVRDELPTVRRLQTIAVAVAGEAADLVRSRAPDWSPLRTKSSPTDIVTQTDLESERADQAAPRGGHAELGVRRRGGWVDRAQRRLQWVVDPLDGTVNFWYGLPVLAVSIAAAVDGVVRAAAVVDVQHGDVFSAAPGYGARLNDGPITARSAPTSASRW